MRYLLRRRVAAGLCAVALMAALVAFPVRAKAAAGAVLPAVSGAVAVTAFLNACGIYPFQDENGQSFGEWGARKLTELWDTYITEVYPQSEGAQAISDVKAFYVNGGYLTMARDTWSRLREFASWISTKYAVATGQSGVKLGEIVGGLLEVPVSVDTPSYDYVKSNGIYTGYNELSRYSWRMTDTAGVYIYYTRTGISKYPYGDMMISRKPFNEYFAASPSILDARGSSRNMQYYEAGVYLSSNWNMYAEMRPGIPFFESNQAAIEALLGGTLGGTFSGITADTGATVAVPAELPEGAELGGLAVAGAEAGADALEDVIESGVMERQKPIVRPVEVEVGEGTAVDAGTGTVADETPSVITITPESVPLSVSDYSIPGIHTLFPFSVPWDIARVWQALDAEPRWPLEDVALTLPAPELWGSEPLVVRFRMEDMPQSVQEAVQSLAATVRAFLLIIACIGFLIFAVGFIKF